MKIKPTIYAHNDFIINISYYRSKNYTFTKQVDYTKNRKLTRRRYKVSQLTTHYGLYHNLDFEIAKCIYTSTSVYYSIFIN